ncbi:MAG: hypothetical protein RM368_19075 [Nostoc sp. DedSLP03]|nr:hypothetical protein [Nostoc sp. DedSLP03]
MKRNPTLPPNFMSGYAIAAPNLQNYSSQGRQGLYKFLACYLDFFAELFCDHSQFCY